MAPDVRRRAIIDATLPLLLEHGPEISTRQIAQAAGVAEGTIFRAFDTKNDLIHATIHAALRPEVALAKLAALPAEQPLLERAGCILDVLRADLVRTRSLFAAVFGSGRNHPGPPPGHKGESAGPHQDIRILLLSATADALAPYADELRLPPAAAARILSAIAFATTITTPDSHLDDPRRLADLVLHGLAKGNQ